MYSKIVENKPDCLSFQVMSQRHKVVESLDFFISFCVAVFYKCRRLLMVLVVKLPAAANEYKFKLPIQLGVTNLSHFVIPHFLQSEFYLSSRLQRNFERIPKPSGYSSQNSCKTQLRQKSI